MYESLRILRENPKLSLRRLYIYKPFERLPCWQVIRQVKTLAEDFKRFTSSLGPLARTTYDTLRLGQHGLHGVLSPVAGSKAVGRLGSCASG